MSTPSAFLSIARAKPSLSTPFRVVPFSRYGVVFQFLSSARSAGSAAIAGFAGAIPGFCDGPGLGGGSIAAPIDCAVPTAESLAASNTAEITRKNHLGDGLFG